MVCGGQCAMICGEELMQLWSAGNWDSPAQVWINCYKKLNFHSRTTGAVARLSASFGQGTGPIFLDDVMCNGLEYRLFDCPNRGLEVDNCVHSQDAGVVCVAGMQ